MPDTYCTLQEAEDYLSAGLTFNNVAWDEAAQQLKLQALESATRVMLRLPWTGLKATLAQRLHHPVAGETTIPTDLKDACALIAVALISGRSTEQDYMNVFTKSEKFGQMSLTRETQDQVPHLLAAVPDFEAWRLIRPYLDVDQEIYLTRGD
jgi:hypothetical protein